MGLKPLTDEHLFFWVLENIIQLKLWKVTLAVFNIVMEEFLFSFSVLLLILLVDL